jgi:AraC family transcriptional regulator
MQKEETRSYYEEKICGVISYIHQNPGGELNIKILSEMFNISYFHFHRIMRSALNEPLGNYINRVRLNNSAKMIRESNDSISDIAEKIGYNNLSSFSKSFSKEFGISPQEYRTANDCSLNSEIDFKFHLDRVVDQKISPKIKIFPPCKVIYIRVKGEYGGKEVYDAWDKLILFAEKAKTISWNPNFFAIYYDDPDVVGSENCISDCCMTVKKKVESDDLVKLNDFEGGKYMVFRYKGPLENLWEVYNILYRDHIILLNKYHLRDAPIVEKYVHYSEKTKPENLVTDVCIPIE